MKARSCAFHPRDWLARPAKEVENEPLKAASRNKFADAALVASTLALFAVLFSALRGAFLSAQWGPF
jgi:hypothetical protein